MNNAITIKFELREDQACALRVLCARLLPKTIDETMGDATLARLADEARNTLSYALYEATGDVCASMVSPA